ncbi:ethylbenzene dehydrogenase-related protein [Halorubrum rutilum]|uniref:Ethylbenzene dehydrogenase-related protein n=1 Tax=Halorubrum rutilum TaxID=1364933 RepID=A0ABD6AGP8_9EURY|nr:ethylbenzene dehydrogenase-related protein [Halorubrum rutilum]
MSGDRIRAAVGVATDRFDSSAVAQAAVVTVAVVALLIGVQAAVSAAAVSGSQPVENVGGGVPSSPGADAWADAERRTVNLDPQRMAIPRGGGSVDEVDVEAVTNESHVAFRLTWEDETRDASLGAPNSYSDAAAVMLRRGEEPPITMGAAGEPVNIWYWRASWQSADDADGTGDMYAYPQDDETTTPGLAADNPLSKERYTRYAQNYYAEGFGSLTHAETQPVSAQGRYTGGFWQVTFVRERTTDGEYDADLTAGEPVHLAFAVWNGSADEVNGAKSLTYRYSQLEGDALSVPGDGSGSDGGSETDGGSGSVSSFVSAVGGGTIAAAVTFLVAYAMIKRKS